MLFKASLTGFFGINRLGALGFATGLGTGLGADVAVVKLDIAGDEATCK
jgi:hypothetical protein